MHPSVSAISPDDMDTYMRIVDIIFIDTGSGICRAVSHTVGARKAEARKGILQDFRLKMLME